VLPPRWVRRLVLAPAVPLLTVTAVVTLPLAVIAAAFASPLLPGRWRPLRVLAFTLAFLAIESVALLAMFVLWVASGFGRRVGDPRWQAAHYTVMDRYLAALVHSAQRTFALNVTVYGTGLEETDPEQAERPVIVLSRHAGPGDSFLLVQSLLERGRRPRIVLREVLRWSPALDVGLGRLPNAFVSPRSPRGAGTAAVVELAAGLGPRDALVLFPEGANFTPERRLRSIAKLEELGHHEEAEHAREMRHVLTPRSGGAAAACTAAPTADVLFVAHTGLEDLSSVVDLWRGLPMDSEVEVEVWRVPAEEVPTDPGEARRWLLGWWRHIDAWLLTRHGPGAVPDATVDVVAEEGPSDPVPPT
jgi:1-acyl-sn-glycerol-3-phosphate acyltransferase